VSTEDQMSIEDRVRVATRAGASLVRDIRPLTAPKPVLLRPRPAPRSRRWINWGIPLAAAAAVVAIALTLVAIRQPGTPSPVASRPAPAAPTTVPRYYVALDGTGTSPLIVGDDLTGKTIATVSPQHGLDFTSVQGTSDDRTFVVLATPQSVQARFPSYTWYLLRIAPGTAHPYQLTMLPIKLPAEAPVNSAYALSPDGQELAVESGSSSQSSSGWVTSLEIYSVPSGAELRAWTMTTDTAGSGPAQSTLSWLSDGRQLAFSTVQSTSADILSQQLRTLDVTGSGTGLTTASRALLTVPLSGASTCWTMHLTPDGGTVVCGTQYDLLSGNGTSADCPQGGLEFTAYSVLTGKPVRVLYQYRGACSNGATFVPWTDASAREIIGAVTVNPQSGGKPAGQIGVITNGHIQLFKIPKSLPLADYSRIAF
jgi:hypothetical protein